MAVMCKSVLELYREKLYRIDNYKTELTSDNISCEINLSRLEEVCCQWRKDEYYLLNNRGRQLLSILEGTLGHSTIKSWLHSDEMKLPPLELLCFLHTAGLMEVTTFLYYKPEFCGEISSQLVEMVTTEFGSPQDQQEVTKIVALVLCSMINVGSHSLRELFSLSSSLMESFTTELIDVLFTQNHQLRLEFLKLILEEWSVFEEGVKSFGVFLLNSLLTHDLSSVSLQSAVGLHLKEWTSLSVPHTFVSLFSQVQRLLGKEGVVKEIELLIEDGRVNLTHLLYAVALMSSNSTQPDQLDILKSSADKWFKDSLAEKNEVKLGLALLIIRHHYGQLSNYLVNYANWFASVQVKNQLAFGFFFEFLSKLVPYEPAVFLKIQVTKVPSGPSSCQQIISDYISLAKTRLSDMNQTYDYISLFNDYHETLEEQQESDVKRVINHFAESGEVNKAVMEGFVFRKQYYEKVFLAGLLSAPRGSSDIRDRLIIKLNTLGKIPSPLYRVWSKSRSS